MKTIEIGELKVQVCEHKGDIIYPRFVKFKQYAPQFWEKMDSPLFEVYYEKILDFHNKGEYANAILALRDYKIALNNLEYSYDAWGTCFALISEIEDGTEKEKFKEDPNDAEIKAKLDLLGKHGLLAATVKTCVLDFMQASPETFTDHLIMFGLQSMTNEIED